MPGTKRVEAARITGHTTEKGKIIQSSDYFGMAITHAHLIRGGDTHDSPYPP